MEIRAIRLTSTMDVMGEFITEDEFSLTLKNAVYVIPQDAGNGRVTAEFHPYAPLFEDTVSIMKTSIQAVLTPVESLANEYSRIFGLIQIADASILRSNV